MVAELFSELHYEKFIYKFVEEAIKFVVMIKTETIIVQKYKIRNQSNKQE